MTKAISDTEDSEKYHKLEFRKPRSTLLNMVGEFYTTCTERLLELSKKGPDGKPVEILDSKCHIVSIY